MTPLAPARRLLAPLLRSAERRLPSLTRLRAAEPLPIRLHRRRIYILPTGFGMVFAVILMVMLLGALNYSNNSAMLLTCLLGAIWIGSMLQTFGNLNHLALQAIHAEPALAGEDLMLILHWQVPGRARDAVELQVGETRHAFRLAADDSSHMRIPIATRRRGWMAVPRMQVGSRWPFGWFRAWSWLAPAQQVLVYPRPEVGGPPPPGHGGLDRHAQRVHGDEWSGLRAYRPGDPLRLVAWKASARGSGLRVKTFDQPRAERTWHLDWDDIAVADREARIARLARWVTEALAANRSWSLRLPALNIPAGQGHAHYRRCMQALAELP